MSDNVIPGVYSKIDDRYAVEQSKELLRRFKMGLQQIIMGPDGAYLKINPDGTLTVTIAGADSNGGAVNTNLKSSEITQPMDHQATLVNTAVTHTGQVVPNGTSNAQATWQPVPEGMSEVITNLLVDLAAANVYTNILWSEDGTNASGKTLQTILATNGAAQKTSTQWFPVGGAFYKVEIQNSDAAPRTCSANIKFRP